MRWKDVSILYAHELRSALRERAVVVNGLLMPVLLYPLLFWGLFSVFSFVGGQEERFLSRLELRGLPAAHAGLAEELGAGGRVALVEPAAGVAPEARLAAGAADAVALFLEAEGDAAALADNFGVILVYDGSKPRAQKARERFEAALEGYRERWVKREAAALGTSAADWRQLRIEMRNVASGVEMGRFLLGLMGPLLMIIMIAVGCLYPAIDATAGERERATWETLLSTAASRTSILWAKYLAVATFGAVAGLLNLVALAVSLRLVLAPMLGERARALELSVPLAALPPMLAAGVLLALFVAAAMMLLAAFARTFKEGQSMVMPFYVLVLVPPLLVQSPDLELTPGWAMVPVANVALLFRDVIAGHYRWPLIGLTLMVEVAAVALCLATARAVLAFEDVAAGDYRGSLGSLLRERFLRRGRRPAGEARS